jgi:hypothetical protein
MPPPKHILERRGLTEEDWAKGIRSAAQKEAIEKGTVPAPAQATTPAPATDADKPKSGRRTPGAGL